MPRRVRSWVAAALECALADDAGSVRLARADDESVQLGGTLSANQRQLPCPRPALRRLRGPPDQPPLFLRSLPPARLQTLARSRVTWRRPPDHVGGWARVTLVVWYDHCGLPGERRAQWCRRGTIADADRSPLAGRSLSA
jgi:hypothetical protein